MEKIKKIIEFIKAHRKAVTACAVIVAAIIAGAVIF